MTVEQKRDQLRQVFLAHMGDVYQRMTMLEREVDAFIGGADELRGVGMLGAYGDLAITVTKIHQDVAMILAAERFTSEID